MNILKEIKYFIQRGKRGFSEQDLWSFDDYLCDIIPPALRQLKKKQTGCPQELWDEKRVNDECHKWKEILEEMAQGFEAVEELTSLNFFKYVREDGYYSRELDEEKRRLLTKKYDRGMKLFCENFMNLWD